VARLGIHRNRPADEDATETLDGAETTDGTETTETTERIKTRRPVIDARRARATAVVDRPVDEPTVTERPVERAPRWARVSALATLGLIVGLVALGTTLTGLLAPVGVAVGVVGGAISAGGLVGASRRGVTGHSAALLGLLFSIAAITLGILAIGGYLPWLDSHTDEVARLRDWLNTHLTFMRNW
jgi:hypothetical protein